MTYLFTEEAGEVTLEKIVFMEKSYIPGASLPSFGSIATIDNIVLSDTEVSFAIQLGEGTSEFCNTGETISLEGEKEEQVAPDASDDSNHVRFINEWRLISVTTDSPSSEYTGGEELICGFFEGEYYDRCYDEATGEISSQCPQATSVTLLVSGYGTFLFSYFDENDNLLSTDQGNWRWRTDAPEFSVFEVKDSNETYEESNISITIVAISDTTLKLTETQEDYGITVTLTYLFQLASLDYDLTNCDNYYTSTTGK